MTAVLGGARMSHGQAGGALGVHTNSLRFAAATGTVLIHWEGGRPPAVWTVPPPEVDPRAARLELAPTGGKLPCRICDDHGQLCSVPVP